MTTDTRERIIRAAHDLMYHNGFHAVGVDQLLHEVGVTKTTFYNHFESKEDVVLEVLRWHDRWWRDTFVEMVRRHGGDTPRGQLMGVFDALQELFDGGDFNGCIFVNVAVQFPQPHDPAHMAAADHKRAMGEIIRQIAAYAGADDPAALAQEMSLILEGAYVTRQVTGEEQAAEIARRLGRLALEKRLPPEPVPGRERARK